MMGRKPEPDSACNGVFGVDLGFVKAFAGGVLYPDESWCNGFMPSRELEYHMKKLVASNKEYREIQKKKQTYALWLGIDYREGEEEESRKERAELARQRIEAFAVKHPETRSYDYMLQHFKDMCGDAEEKRSQMSEHKEHIAHLYARDVVAHVIEQGLYEIHVEDLRDYSDVSGRWEFSKIFSCIANEAELFGISTFLVYAKGTSKTVPFSGEFGRLRKDRQLVFPDGDSMDRDDAACLNTAFNEPVRIARGSSGYSKSHVGSKRSHARRSSAKKSAEDRRAVAPYGSVALSIDAAWAVDGVSVLDGLTGISAIDDIDFVVLGDSQVCDGDVVIFAPGRRVRCRPNRERCKGVFHRRPLRRCYPRAVLNLNGAGLSTSVAFSESCTPGLPGERLAGNCTPSVRETAKEKVPTFSVSHQRRT